MYEEQEFILELGEQISVLSEIMNQLTEISKEIPPENKQKMKPITIDWPKAIGGGLGLLIGAVLLIRFIMRSRA